MIILKTAKNQILASIVFGSFCSIYSGPKFSISLLLHACLSMRLISLDIYYCNKYYRTPQWAKTPAEDSRFKPWLR